MAQQIKAIVHRPEAITPQVRTAIERNVQRPGGGKVFEVTGARATQASVGLDRHWRNLRTQSLHDPLDYKLHELGDWALNQRLPIPTFYS